MQGSRAHTPGFDSIHRAAEVFRARDKPMLDTVLKVARGGGRVIAGTDSPIFPFAIAFHAKLQDYVNAGLLHSKRFEPRR
jgi:hypothetical protein